MELITESKHFGQWVNRSLEGEENFHFLRFEFLQRLNFTQLQLRLVHLKSQIQKNGEASKKDLKSTLVMYGKYKPE